MKDRNTANTLVRRSIEELMPPDTTLNIQEIKDLLLAQKSLAYGKDYTEGNLSNALYVLSNAGILTKKGRGLYQKLDCKEDINSLNKSTTLQSGSVSCKIPEYPAQNLPEEQDCLKETAASGNRSFTYELKDILDLFRTDQNKIKEISEGLSTVLQNVNLHDATTQELEILKQILAFREAVTALVKEFGQEVDV